MCVEVLEDGNLCLDLWLFVEGGGWYFWFFVYWVLWVRLENDSGELCFEYGVF